MNREGFLLDKFTADRELAGQLLIVNAGVEQWARSIRAFVVAVAARAAREGGIAQFLDLSAGLPTRPAMHEAMREVNRVVRVVHLISPGTHGDDCGKQPR